MVFATFLPTFKLIFGFNLRTVFVFCFIAVSRLFVDFEVVRLFGRRLLHTFSPSRMNLVAFPLVCWNNADVVQSQLFKEHGNYIGVHFEGQSEHFEDILENHIYDEIEDGAIPKEGPS